MRERPVPQLASTTQLLGPSEHMFMALRRFTPTNVCRVIAIEGELSPRAVQLALRHLQARHPLLRSHVVDAEVPYFVHGEAGAPQLHVVQRENTQHWRRVLERALNTPLTQAPGPLCEVHYVYGEGQRAAELIVVAEHVICDGISINQLCAELLELCARPEVGMARPALPVLERMLPEHGLQARLLGFGAALTTFARVSFGRALSGGRRCAESSSYAYRELDPEQTRGLLEQARRHETTLTGILLAAVTQVLAERYPDERRYAISVPINLRSRLRGRALSAEDLGNYTSVAYLETRPNTDPWRLAALLKRKLDTIVASDRLLSAVSLIYRTGRLCLRPGRPPLAHAMLSNSGIVPLRRDYGAFRTLAFRSATSAPMLSADSLLLLQYAARPSLHQSAVRRAGVVTQRGRAGALGAGAQARCLRPPRRNRPMTRMTLDELIERYDQDHQHPANRALHMVGITLIGSSVVLLVPAPPLAAALFVSGWAAQLVGHRIEGKPPSFTRDPRFMVVGAFWYARRVRELSQRLAHARTT
ncbi:MAG: DUF962 domain-containing protein [Myxococcales bacterium]